MKLVWTTIMFILITLVGCSSNNNPIEQLEYGKPDHTTLAWNNRIYEITSESVPQEKIGKQIGKAKDQVSPKPTKNGDVARNTPKGPSIIHGEGNIYEIKGIKQEEQIAVELSKKKYFKCV